MRNGWNWEHLNYFSCSFFIFLSSFSSLFISQHKDLNLGALHDFSAVPNSEVWSSGLNLFFNYYYHIVFVADSLASLVMLISLFCIVPSFLFNEAFSTRIEKRCQLNRWSNFLTMMRNKASLYWHRLPTSSFYILSTFHNLMMYWNELWKHFHHVLRVNKTQKVFVGANNTIYLLHVAFPI